MPEKTNRRDLILDVASELFRQQGYTGTSIRQIAQQSGVTEAALYYHFKDGKRALLSAVLAREMPNFEHQASTYAEIQTLTGFVRQFAHNMLISMPQRSERLRWIIAEYPHMDAPEKDLFHQQHMALHAQMSAAVRPFVSQDDEAEHLAWLIANATFGYGIMFISLGLQDVSDFALEDFLSVLTKSISFYAKTPPAT